MPSRRVYHYPPWNLEGKAGFAWRSGPGRYGCLWHSVTPPSHRPEEAGAEVPLLPLDALHLLAEQLDQDDLEQALLLLKLFIILCRWLFPSVL